MGVVTFNTYFIECDIIGLFDTKFMLFPSLGDGVI